MRPNVGFIATRPLLLPGWRTEPPVSVPIESRPIEAAVAEPEPLLEVPGLRDGSQALRQPTGPLVSRPISETTLPTRIAPASSSSRCSVACSGGR